MLSRERRDALLWYTAGLKQGLHIRLALANLASGLLPDAVSSLLRVPLYRLAGFKIGTGCTIRANVKLISGVPDFYDKLVLGPNVFISDHVTINLDAEVRLGENVSIGPHVLIYTGGHKIGPSSQRRLPDVTTGPVTIEDGAWIQVGAVILPGVTIGRGTIVAAGAVVFQDVPPNSYVRGNPAKVVSQLPSRVISAAWGGNR